MQPRTHRNVTANCRSTIQAAAVLMLLLSSTICAGEPATELRGPSLRGEFTIGKGGRLVLLSVNLGDESVLCLLDTGACLSGFDESLRDALGERRGSRLLKTPAGPKLVETYSWPDARLGDQSLKTDQPIACLVLENIRRATNENIRGVIGMDVLRSCRWQMDFDHGVIRFLESLPEHPRDLGAKVALQLTDDGSPFLAGSVGASGSEYFLIDTGAHGNSFAAETFDALLKRGLIRLGSSFASVTVAGEVRGDRGNLSHLSIGPFAHQGLRFSRVNVNSLGIRYFSRFHVTFDFPGKAVYLRKGAGYAKAEPRATSGLTLNWIKGDATVESVRRDGPGEAAGLKPKDVLVRINRQDAAEFDPFALRQLLTFEGGQRVPLTIRRAGREIDVVVVLSDD